VFDCIYEISIYQVTLENYLISDTSREQNTLTTIQSSANFNDTYIRLITVSAKSICAIDHFQ